MDLLVWLVLLLDLNYFKPVFIFFPLSLQLPSLAASHSVTSALCAVIHHLTPGSLPPSHSLSCNACSRPAALPPAATDSSRLLRAARITAEGRRYLQVLPVITSCPFSTADTLAALIWPNVGWGFVEKQTVCCSWVGHFLKIQRIKWISIIKPQTKRKCSVFFFFFLILAFFCHFSRVRSQKPRVLWLCSPTPVYSVGRCSFGLGPAEPWRQRSLGARIPRHHHDLYSVVFQRGFELLLVCPVIQGLFSLGDPTRGIKSQATLLPKSLRLSNLPTS